VRRDEAVTESMRGVRADVGLRQTFELERHLDV
jgi:hypothetical protein